MGRGQDLEQVIAPGATVAIDTMAFICLLEESPVYAPVVAPFFTALEAGTFSAVTSVLTLLELRVLPLRQGRPDAADDYEALLTAFPNFAVADVSLAVTRVAAHLRADWRLRTVDAVQVATGLENGAAYFLTNDYSFERLSGIEVLIIDDFLPDGRPKARGQGS